MSIEGAGIVQVACLRCGRPINELAIRRGRKRRWCTTTCRDKTYRSRKAMGLVLRGAVPMTAVGSDV